MNNDERLGKRKEMERLREMSKPIIDYLRENYNQNAEVKISDKSIKLLTDEFAIKIDI